MGVKHPPFWGGSAARNWRMFVLLLLLLLFVVLVVVCFTSEASGEGPDRRLTGAELSR